MSKDQFVIAYVLARANALETMDSDRVVRAAFNAWDRIRAGLNGNLGE